jgi:hypothetical protein
MKLSYISIGLLEEEEKSKERSYEETSQKMI